MFPRCNPPCEYVAGLMVPTDGSGPQNNEVVVFPDLALDRFYSEALIVTGTPSARFYAGVPITTSNGYNIGVYCVVDDLPRKGLSASQTDFMKDMSLTIMSHLEMVRAKADLRRSQNMVQGLGEFIDGSSCSKKWWRRDSHHPTPRTAFQSFPVQSGEIGFYPELLTTDLPSPTSEEPPEEVIESYGLTLPCRKSRSSRPRTKRSVSFTGTNESKRSTSFHPTGGSIHGDGSEAASLQEESISADIRSIFGRAASTILEAVELDGAMFLDASVGVYGGLVKHSLSRKSSGLSQPDTSAAFSSKPTQATAEEKPCVVLGCSVQKEDDSPANEDSAPIPSVSEAFLQELLHKYPRGNIWTYDPPGDEHAHTEVDTDSTDDQVRERKAIGKLFPGVRSLAFVGMWDSNRRRWFAGSIMWTRSPMRILSSDLELRYLVAFGQSIMAEVARVDVKSADKAKSTFISSISHELRTPLHGIMGSSECLQSTEVDAFQSDLLATIDTCGKTLLDTFDNLLSFAKINNLMNNSHSRRESLIFPPKAETPTSGIGMALENVELGLLTEEVMEAVFAGHKFKRFGLDDEDDKAGARSTTRSKICYPTNRDGTRDFSPVRVVLIYDDPVSSKWNFKTQPGGWRRIIMNLVGNSLKYTDAGSITVKLESSVLSGAEDQSQVVLTVKDTGRGMSQDFLQSHIFSPFVQENPLNPGTGLGLSIVKQIVTGLGGIISVESEKGQGTEIRVTFAMTHAPAVSQDVPCASHIATTRGKGHGLRLNILDVAERNPSLSLSDTVDIETALGTLCSDWFGLTAVSSAEPQDADIYTITERQIDALTTLLVERPTDASRLVKKPLIVFCNDSCFIRNSNLEKMTSSLGCHVVKISQPYGPNKMAKAFGSCFEFLQSSGDGDLSGRQGGSSKSVTNDTPGELDLAIRCMDHRPHVSQRFDSVQSELDANLDDGLLASLPSCVVLDEDSTSPLAVEVKFDLSSRGTLPRTNLIPRGSLTDVSSQKTDASSSEGTKPKISVLLVDDNRINLQLLSTFIKKQKHYRYEVATDGFQAFQVYQAGPARLSAADPAPDGSTPSPRSYDFVLMDINMPVWDGLESTRQIRAFEQNHNLPPATIIALTGLASAGAQQEAFASGVDLFLTKPVRLKELTSILEGKV
ncbi:hypothetical protein MBLNU459_g6339t3 [Dothideomycetes sp. NU459]